MFLITFTHTVLTQCKGHRDNHQICDFTLQLRFSATIICIGIPDSLQEVINKGIVVQAEDGDASHLKCVVCDVICTGEEPMKQHVEGRSHQKKLR